MSSGKGATGQAERCELRTAIGLAKRILVALSRAFNERNSSWNRKKGRQTIEEWAY